ncbi:MAG: type III pantothenate kinase [Armatimonadetes bacterium]|nr:type III pantothenate kinase [Armatimonadota bacterium]
MLLAIDVGNTQTVYGFWSRGAWRLTLRRETHVEETEDEIAAWLWACLRAKALEPAVTSIVCASVVPAMERTVTLLAAKWFKLEPTFVTASSPLGIQVCYEPPSAVGADRICNALGALAKYKPPIIVVDFGTATTFDVIDADGHYAGGAILPGLMISARALATSTAKLPSIAYKAPERAIGRNTVESIQSGLMLGYAGAIDSLAARIGGELKGDATVIATGGLSEMFMGLAKSIQHLEPDLTLDGLRMAHQKITKKK